MTTHHTPESDEAIADYCKALEADGYCVIDDILSTETARKYRKILLELYQSDPGVAAKRNDDRDLYHVENLPNKHPAFENFFLTEPLLKLAETVLGPHCILKDAWSLGIPPQGGRTGESAKVFSPLHVEDPLVRPDMVLSLICLFNLAPTTVENGATTVVPGTHISGKVPTGQRHPKEIQLELPEGSCLVFTGSLWHSSSPNRSSSIRVGLGVTFSVPWVKPFFDFTRSLDPALIERATPTARRLFGFNSRVPYRERWMWDWERGEPKEPGKP